MNVADYVARQTERMAEGLAHFVATTPADRLVWHPTVPGASPTRSILEQISECVQVNRYLAALLRHSEATPYGPDTPPIPFTDGLDAQEQLIGSARELAASISGMSDADLAATYAHPRGPMLGENVILAPLRNMAYHAGQINLIQILSGDPVFHVPPTWR